MSAPGKQMVERRFGHRGNGAGGLSLPPGFDVKGLALVLAGADYALTVGTTRAVLAFHGVLLGDAHGRLCW
jgi:hypothetical protein